MDSICLQLVGSCVVAATVVVWGITVTVVVWGITSKVVVWGFTTIAVVGGAGVVIAVNKSSNTWQSEDQIY